MKRELLCAAAAWLACAPTTARGAGLEAIGTECRADTAFPQFMPLWSEGWALKNKDGDPLQYAKADMPLGAYVHVYLRNSSGGEVEVRDVLLEGDSLSDAIAFSDKAKVSGMFPASIRFSKLPKDSIERLMNAGEPVWWKAEPNAVPAGGMVEIIVRLRRMPKQPALWVEVVAGELHAAAQIPIDGPASPRLEGISFPAALDTVTVYARHPKKDVRPVGVRIDGADLIGRSRIAFDPAVDTGLVIVHPEQPLAPGSFHLFEVVYADGSAARAGQRAFGGEFVYGMWGYINQGKTAQERVDYYLRDMRRHNVNALMQSYGKDVASWLNRDEGLAHRRKAGLGVMINGPGGMREPLYLFLTDEPDAHDYAVKQLDADDRLGVLGQPLVQRGRKWREKDATTPQLLNVDNTFKPENWYMYGQLADVYCADPYYQEQQRAVWNERPAWAAAFVKPTYVLGVTTVCRSACAPRPLHIILNCVRHDTPKAAFRFATPAEKRVEVFYALAAGARGLSYWWYTPYGEFHGCGSSDPAAVALWREIGLLGALARTAGPLLERSCPAGVAVKPPARLWARSLLAGQDALVLLVVNESIASDRQGTVVVPVEKSSIAVTPPAWLKPADVFEISERGVGQVTWRPDGTQVAMDPGRLEVARMFVVTSDSKLREMLARRHAEQFAENVANLNR